jgi:hypothetical protein
MRAPCQLIQTVVKLPQSEPGYNAKNQKSLPAAGTRNNSRPVKMSNDKVQISNEIQSSNFKGFLILKFDIDLAFGF